MNRVLWAMALLLVSGPACKTELDVGNMNADPSGGGGATSTTASGHAGGASGVGGSQVGSGGSTGTTPTPPCTPSAGTTVLDYDVPTGTTMQIAILANAGASTRLAFLGTTRAQYPAPGCAVIDSIELTENGSTLQTIDASAMDLTGDAATAKDTWLEVDAKTAVSARCSDTSDHGRVDTVGVLFRGRMDGGTFTVRVGRATAHQGSWGWPPAVVVTCHEGLESAPDVGSALRDLSSTTGPATTIYASYGLDAGQPHVETFDGTIDIVPVASPPTNQPFNDATRPLPLIHTSGWTFHTMDESAPGSPPLCQVQLQHGGDPIGDQGCPVNSDPQQNPAPVLIARVTGTTDTGSHFSSEIATQPCAVNPP